MNISDNITKNAIVDKLLKAGHIDLSEAKELLSVETQYQFVPLSNGYAVSTGTVSVANNFGVGTSVDLGNGTPCLNVIDYGSFGVVKR